MFVISILGSVPFYLKDNSLDPKKTSDILLAKRFNTKKEAQELLITLSKANQRYKNVRYDILPYTLVSQVDEKIISKYLSNKVSIHTKQTLSKAFDEVRNNTRAESWIHLTKKNTNNDLIGIDVLLVLNLSEFKVSPFVTTGRLFYSEKEIHYGNLTHRMGVGKTIGYFWVINEIIYPTKYITHYQQKPTLPHE